MAGVPRKAFSRALDKFYDWIEGRNTNGTLEAVTGLTVRNEGVGPYRKTVLVLDEVPLAIVSVTTGNGVGGKKLYTFPAGRLAHFGTMANLSIKVAAAKQADFTDATPEGDLGIGTVAPANADALGTDATDDNFATAAAFTMAAYASAVVGLPSEAIQQFNGTGTPVPLFVNALVDAADIDNDVTTEVLVSGEIVVHWANLGDI
jgi:hypothetical protein